MNSLEIAILFFIISAAWAVGLVCGMLAMVA